MGGDPVTSEITNYRDAFSLDGKVALVTGAAGTLGAEICRVLTSVGASVLITDIVEDRGIALRDELRKCEESTIIGVASIHIIYKLTRTLGLIEDVAVNKDHRGKGIGKSLVEKLIEIGKQKNCDKIVLNTSEKNSKFYEKIGFEKNEIQMVIRN